MADRDELYAALRNADAAGDTAAAQRLASYIQSLPPAAAPSKPFGQQLNDAIHDVPRQIGLTARAGLRAVDGAANFVAAPARAALNAVLPKKNAGIAGQIAGAKQEDAIAPINLTGLADRFGLPRPRPGIESVVNDAATMVAGGALPLVSGASLAKNTTGVAQGVGKLLAANPLQQLASAGAAGAAGGYTRETGGDDTSQTVAALAAGIATPFAMSKVASLPRIGRPAAPTPQQIDVTINSALQGGSDGVSFGDLPGKIQAGIRQDVKDAFRLTGNISPDAIRRLTDYRLTGATPTAGSLTLDPGTVTRQKNLAKLGINSKDATAQALGQTENANNRALIENINRLGAGGSPVDGGRRIIGALANRDKRAGSIIGDAYDAARATGGRSALLDHEAFITRANTLLDDALLGGKLPGDVRNVLGKDWQKVVKGPAAAPAPGTPPKENYGLPVDVAEQIKSRIGDLQRASTDGAERKALGLTRQALDDAPLLPGQQMGEDSIAAFNRARRLNRSWMGIVEKTPALQAVRDGIEPDKFVQQFIVGNGGKANIADVNALHSSIKSNPDAMQAVREQIVGHLKAKALNGAADEVGKISQSAYNKALIGIGDEKLSKFFSKPEVDQLKAIGRVASYEQFQPAGTAVNNSNTAAAGLSKIFDLIAESPLLSKIPLGSALSQPMQNISVGINSGRALNVPHALAAPKIPGPRQPAGLLASPALFMSDDDEERKKKGQRGLLSRE